VKQLDFKIIGSFDVFIGRAHSYLKVV